MSRANTVLLATFAAAIVGLIGGWLTMQSELRMYSGIVSQFTYFLCFLIAPAASAAAGFWAAVVAIRMFPPTDGKSN